MMAICHLILSSSCHLSHALAGLQPFGFAAAAVNILSAGMLIYSMWFTSLLGLQCATASVYPSAHSALSVVQGTGV